MLWQQQLDKGTLFLGPKPTPNTTREGSLEMQSPSKDASTSGPVTRFARGGGCPCLPALSKGTCTQHHSHLWHLMSW